MADVGLTVAAAREKIQRMRAQLANVKDDAKRAAKMGVDSVIVVAGGAAAGFIQAKMPTIGTSTVPTAGVVGAAVTALAMSGVLDDEGDRALLFGAGILAAVAAAETEKLLAAA